MPGMHQPTLPTLSSMVCNIQGAGALAAQPFYANTGILRIGGIVLMGKCSVMHH